MIPRKIVWVTALLLTSFIIGSSGIYANNPDIVESRKSTLLESDLLINIDARNTTSLDGTWNSIIDPYQSGYYTYRYRPSNNGFFRNRRNEAPGDAIEYDFELSELLEVPGDWNTQMEKLYLYEGTLWYKKDFSWNKTSDKRVFLHFGAVNYDTRVWVNEDFVGRHEGGFTPFNFEITNQLEDGENFVVLMVDNTRRREAVPAMLYDWWNYGGITRSVNLVETEETFIQDYFVQLSPGSRDQVEGWVRLNGSQSQQQVTITIPETGLEVQVFTDSDGYAEFTMQAELELWSPENPKLYHVLLTSGFDQIADTIGFRSLEVRGEDILLNGEAIFLRGVNIHEEAPYRSGRAHSEYDAKILLDWVQQMGGNYVRLAHYPHNEQFVREADRRGIMIWSEIPLYWAIQWENPDTYENARNQLAEMIHRDKNRAAVIMWSLFNEVEESEERTAFIRSLIDHARELDPTRLLTGALEVKSYHDRSLYRMEDPLGADVDVIGINQYHGWFGGTIENMEDIRWESDFKKPIVISEFGGAAKQGYRAGEDQRYSEDFRVNLYMNTLAMLENISSLRGVSPWILMDFRSPRRHLPRLFDGWSRGGLISNQGIKKESFYIMQDWYHKIEAGDIQFGDNQLSP